MTAPHLSAGHTIAGKYTISSLLAFTREMASYAARDHQGNDVVVKLYDSAIAQRADVMAKLDRVRQVIAALPEDMVVHVVDAGYDASTAAPFSVTPQLSQPSLAKLVSTGALSVDVVAKIMTGVGRSLAAAQQYQLFHHGLKPTNIFVGPAPSYSVRLMDFGVSIVRGTSPTHEAYAACAPWWAPEQLQASEQGGAATDVFASALVAFFALTGQSYWRSCHQSPIDLNAWQQELLGPRTPVSLRAEEFGMNLHAALDTVFLRSLAVSIGDRAGQADELVQALAALGGTPVGDSARTLALPEEFDPAMLAGGSAAPAQAAHPQGGGQAPAAHAFAQHGYPATGTPHPPGADVSGGHATPGLPNFPTAQAKKPNKALLPVIFVIVATLLLGGGVAGFFVMQSGSVTEDDAHAKAAPAASGGVGGAAPAASTDATKSSEAGGGVAAVPSGSAEAATGGAAPDGTGGAAPAEDVKVSITCIPRCGAITVDGKKVRPDKDDSFMLSPGEHTVVLVRGGFRSKKIKVNIEAGTPFEKKVALVRVRRRQPPPSCGQFLNQCP